MSKILWVLDRTVEAVAAAAVALSTVLVCINVFVNAGLKFHHSPE